MSTPSSSTSTPPRYADFDAAFAEESTPPITIRLHGRDWLLPGVMPSAFMLKVARWMEEGRSEKELTGPELVALAGDIVPSDILNAWQAAGLSIEQLERVLMYLIEQYTAGDPTPTSDAEGNALTPSAAGSSSSNGGGSSPQTSNASTGSSSPGTWKA